MNPSNVPIDSGVYRITCKPTGRSYIGSTIHSRGRCFAHRTSLRRGNHSNRRLQSEWNLYGEDAFEFVMVESVDEARDLLAREKIWILRYRNDGPSYNEYWRDGWTPYVAIMRRAARARQEEQG
jgi:group I intron endonuclease